MNPPRILIATTTAALLAGGGVALASTPPAISAQHSLTGKSPVSVPGTGVHRGDRIPAGARLIYRTVTLSRGQHPDVTLTAPAGKTLRGLANGDSRIGFTLLRPRDYPGKRRVVVRVTLGPTGKDGSSGRIYALVR